MIKSAKALDLNLDNGLCRLERIEAGKLAINFRILKRKTCQREKLKNWPY